ncbi:MAG: TMAO reductase system periplasmic protein TorT [Acidimicrobiaceae bacterium]|nr:TMAO reductase system periplasmic protein TorT [Acidimicrobiaceae bacterium]
MSTRRPVALRVLSVLLATQIVAAACGDDDDDSAVAPQTTQQADSTAAAPDDAAAAADEPSEEPEPAAAPDDEAAAADEVAAPDDAAAAADEPSEEPGPAAAADDEAAPADWAPYPVEVWSVPGDATSPRTVMDYVPVAATQAWNICVSFPHMKDAYWLAVDYGAVEESRRQGVSMTLVEAGGYTNLDTQISQIEDCVQGGADAVVVGAISFDGLNNLVDEIAAQGIPVIDVINGMSSENLTAKSLVSFGEMGANACSWLANHVGDEATSIAWFPGPAGAGWVEAGNAGCVGALEGTSVTIVDTKFGDTGKEAQSILIEDALAANPDVDFIVGTAVTAEAATSILRDRGLDDEIGVVSYYFTPGIFEGLQSGRILAAPTDSPVIQARIAIDQAVRALEGLDFEEHVGPALFVVDVDTIDTFDSTSTLAPPGFDPVFSVG